MYAIADSTVNRSGQVFADHALKLRHAGLAVLPASGKAPMISGFPRMKRAPSLKAIEGWAEKNPDADIVFVPGLSRTADGSSIVTLDADDLEASEFVERTFGDTPARTRTRKGRHHHYKLPEGINLGPLHSLRPFGLNIDVKHGQSGAGIVVAPPSRHADERSFVYSWDGSDENALRDMPALDVGKLLELTAKAVAARNRETLPLISREIGYLRDGSRGLWLNDRLCRDAPWCETCEALLDCGLSHNQALVSYGLEPLSIKEVTERVAAVWRDVEAGKIVRMHKQRATMRANGNEIDLLMKGYGNGAEAFALLGKLRVEHGARVSRGEAFVIAIEAMVRAKIMGNWSARKYREARETLIDAGFVRLVSPARRRVAATYTLE
ncbi:MAG: bifunctional DNA primase/polymerase [Proteobacteria bacterium]|nr:bifunctional DNA primase/polymerase [Pseudomonadota bacterium]